VPCAVRRDADAIEYVRSEFLHLLVVGAGRDLQQLDLLLGGELFQRHVGEIRPHEHLLPGALVNADEAGVQHRDENGKSLDAVGSRIRRLPEGDRILLVAEREHRQGLVRLHDGEELVEVAGARRLEDAFAHARDARRQPGEIPDDLRDGGTFRGGALGRFPRGRARLRKKLARRRRKHDQRQDEAEQHGRSVR